MDRERFLKVDRILEEILEHPEEERAAVLGEACGSDAELRREVGDLLRAGKEGEGFLSKPLDGDAVARAFDGAHPPLEEEQLGPYQLVEVLGRGGAAVVYRATGDDGEVAVKVSRFSWKQAYARRFEAEREILARLEHPGIAGFLDGGVTADGRPYLVMEFVDGLAIDRFCDQQCLEIAGRLELFSQVCLAVSHAHHHGVVHRDLKPPNVMVTKDGRVKLLDFGIAKLLDPERFAIDISRTHSGQRLLTPGYASPEQVDNTGVTAASDVYSLGVLLFELLTGRSPYRFTSTWPLPLELAAAVCERPPWSLDETLTQLVDIPELAREVCAARGVGDLEELRGRFGPGLKAVVEKALAKDPADRYASAAAFADAVRDELP